MSAERHPTWYDTTAVPAPERKPVRGLVEVETCVVGGGLAGLATALDLAERGRSVAVVEAESVAWGASGRNGGFVAAGYPAGNLHLVEAVGPTKARELYGLSRMGQALLAERIDRYAMPGIAKEMGALRCAMRGHDAALDRQRRILSDVYGVEVELWSPARVRSLLETERYGGGLYNPETFALHPQNLALGLAAAAEGLGARIFESSAARKLDLSGPVKRIHTAAGEVRARTVVITCGGYIKRLVRSLNWATVPIATFVAVSEPMEAALDSAIRTRMALSDIQFATNYYRRVEGGRLLWGGRVKAWEPHPARIARDLHRDLIGFYPGLKEARFAYTWSGLMSYLAHHMPAIGRLGDDVWYATGFGGLGLALTSMAGRLLAGAIDQDDQRWRLFEAFGLPFAGGILGRVPAQLLYWRAAWQGSRGKVTARE